MLFKTSLPALGLSAAAALTVLASAGSVSAETLRNKWCSDVHLRFFAGGAEGDAFASIVYNGAVQAAHDTGAQVDYVFSGWKAEMMVQQLREAVASQPDGIAMMGHAGEAAIMPLAEQAAGAGIKMMYQNVPLPAVVARFGGGYVGAQQGPAGRGAWRRGGPPFRLEAGRHGDCFRSVRPAAGALRARRRHGRRVGGCGSRGCPHSLTDRMGGRSESRDTSHNGGADQQSRYEGNHLSRWTAAGQRADLYAGGGQEAGPRLSRSASTPARRSSRPSRTAGCSSRRTSSRSCRDTCRS